MHRRLFSIATVLLALTMPMASAGPTESRVFVSGPERVSLLELYTSEGCSSCPPADRWLSRLKTEPDLWRRFAPIAFHVDYWNYIGWRDRFSDARFSERQRRYAREGGARAVYTPGFFKDGLEWRRWRQRDAPQADVSPAGELRIDVDADTVQARFTRDDMAGQALTVHVALLGMGIETRVQAGENRGRTLRHDFVALGVRSMPLSARGKSYEAELALPDTSVRAQEHALVAWVTQGDRQAPLQAAGGLL